MLLFLPGAHFPTGQGALTLSSSAELGSLGNMDRKVDRYIHTAYSGLHSTFAVVLRQCWDHTDAQTPVIPCEPDLSNLVYAFMLLKAQTWEPECLD
jgi:hypothetical protein